MGNHAQMPSVGLGTWKLWGQECETVVRKALELGYRHIDTADMYENHREISRAIEGWPRKELFIATKLMMGDLTPDAVRRSTQRFLEELKVDYVDLLLIHWPDPGADLLAALQEMAKLAQEGVTRYIGVSNFVRSHLKMMQENHLPIFTNQIEMHPYFQRRELVQAYKKAGIGITAYRPLAQGAFETDPTLIKIGKQYGKTPSQIALRWLIEQDIPVIPKASDEKHLRDNIDIFDFALSAQDKAAIDALDASKRYCAPEGFPIYED